MTRWIALALLMTTIPAFAQSAGGGGVPGPNSGGGIVPSAQYNIPTYNAGGSKVQGSNITTDSTGNSLYIPNTLKANILSTCGSGNVTCATMTPAGTPTAWTMDTTTATTAGSSVGVPHVNVELFGATGNGSTDDTSAEQAAISYCESNAFRNGCTIEYPPGTYLTTSPLTVSSSRININGSGQKVTTIEYVPTTSGTTALTFSSGASINYQSSLSNLSFESSDTTYTKTAIHLSDVSGFILKNVQVDSWHDTTDGSIGLQTNGRELSTIAQSSIDADTALLLGTNPNFPNDLEDLDHWHFYDLTLESTGNPVINGSAATFSDTIFDGYQAWIGGTDGFYADSASTVASHNLVFRNVRYEQASTTSAYIFYYGLTSSGGLQQLELETIYGGRAAGGSSINGISLAGGSSGAIFGVKIDNYLYSGTGNYLALDSKVYGSSFRNIYAPGSTTYTLPTCYYNSSAEASTGYGNVGVGVLNPTTAFSICNGSFYGARNAAGTTDQKLIGLNNSNQVQIGDGTLPIVNSAGMTLFAGYSGTTTSIGGSALVEGQCAGALVAIAGVTTSMAAAASPTTYPGDGFVWDAYPESGGVVVKVCALVAGTPTASAYNVRVIQ